MEIKTRFLIISDTHGGVFNIKDGLQADVAIHCGDLTEESKIDEFHRTIDLLRRLPAPLKLVISGNHDLTLDRPTFKKRINEALQPIEPELVERNFGADGEARRLIDGARDAGVIFLDEGNHEFALANGALLRVYASPFTPSRGGWAFQYPPEAKHDFTPVGGVHVAITHGPPHGIMDHTESKQRAGCPQLFGAIARAKPLLHCFGHIHEGWGSKLVTWREQLSENPSHFSAIENSRSVVIEKLSNLARNKHDDAEAAKDKALKLATYTTRGYCRTSHCSEDEHPLKFGLQTLFVNASIEGLSDKLPKHPPWLVDIQLPQSCP